MCLHIAKCADCDAVCMYYKECVKNFFYVTDKNQVVRIDASGQTRINGHCLIIKWHLNCFSITEGIFNNILKIYSYWNKPTSENLSQTNIGTCKQMYEYLHIKNYYQFKRQWKFKIRSICVYRIN